MSLASVCGGYGGPSDFRSGTRGAAVWFHESDGSVRRMAWQGDSVIRAIQGRLGLEQDGVWGQRTNEALRARMRQFRMDVSVVRDGTINRAMIEAALAVAYTLGVDPQASAPAATICVPSRAILPRWLVRSGDDGDGGQLVDSVVEEGGAPVTGAPLTRWRRPAESQVIEAGIGDDDNTFVTYRTAGGEARRALLTPEGALIEDRLATADEAAAVGNTNLNPPRPAEDPGMLAPGETQAPQTTPSPQAANYGNALATPRDNTPIVVGAILVGALVIGLTVASLVRPAAAPTTDDRRKNPGREGEWKLTYHPDARNPTSIYIVPPPARHSREHGQPGAGRSQYATIYENGTVGFNHPEIIPEKVKARARAMASKAVNP